MDRSCPCCNEALFERLIDFGPVPVSGYLRTNPTEPLPSAPLAFELCGSCGLVRQVGIGAPRDYSDVDRATAGQFPAYGESLVAKLTTMDVAPDDLIVEIGSNDGSFLERLQTAGFRHLAGVEPSHRLAEVGRGRGFAVVNDYFTAQTAAELQAIHGPARAVICRHTLEHVPDPLAFLQALRDCLDPSSGVALVEVPDGAAIPERMNIGEFWDEHLYYFSEANLVRLLERAGMTAQEVEVQPHLDTRNLLAWCAVGTKRRRANAPVDEAATWRGLAAAWEACRIRLTEALIDAPRPLYLIGASHPQINYANYARIGSLVDYFIDDDPAKVGRFPSVAGGNPSVISTRGFEEMARAGTVLRTGFGYPKWTARVCGYAARRGMRTLDPIVFAGSSNQALPKDIPRTEGLMTETREPQYQPLVDLKRTRGLARLGMMNNQVWEDDPRRLVFTLARYKFVAKMLNGRKQVLEVGCGDAFASRIVKQTVANLTVVDFDPVFIADIEERADPAWPMEAKVHDILMAPLEGQFDGIYSLDVLEHISAGDENRYMANMVASLDPHGAMIIGMPSLESQTYASPQSKEGHINCKSGSELEGFLGQFFHNVFLFSMNDEVVHTGFSSMAHYLLALCTTPRGER